MKKVYFSTCTIHRTRWTEHGTLDIVTGETATQSAGLKTGACYIPLFRGIERTTGVCRSCHEGYEVEGRNFFATPAERERAVAAWGDTGK